MRKLIHYFLQHLQAGLASLGRLYRSPIASVMTISVIAVALALPSGFLLLLSNAEKLSSNWQSNTQISLYLKMSVGETQARQLAQTLRVRPEVADVEYISPSDGLTTLISQAAFANVLVNLPENPLPAVIIVYPQKTSTPTAVEALYVSLNNLLEVETAQLDLQWLKRLYQIMQIAKRGVFALLALFALAVLLIIGNTIRLNIQNRHEEIEVIKLIGGTDGFVRRPFLYSGFFIGFLAGCIAWALVSSLILWLQNPVLQLMSLYDSDFYLQTFNLHQGLSVAALGGVLGLCGAWLAVKWQLKGLLLEH